MIELSFIKAMVFTLAVMFQVVKTASSKSTRDVSYAFLTFMLFFGVLMFASKQYIYAFSLIALASLILMKFTYDKRATALADGSEQKCDTKALATEHILKIQVA